MNLYDDMIHLKELLLFTKSKAQKIQHLHQANLTILLSGLCYNE
jgi:hypothetical protein